MREEEGPSGLIGWRQTNTLHVLLLWWDTYLQRGLSSKCWGYVQFTADTMIVASFVGNHGLNAKYKHLKVTTLVSLSTLHFTAITL